MKENKNKKKTLFVSPSLAGSRLDQFLTKSQLVKTRSQALKLISEKQVFLNGSHSKASCRLRSGDLLELILPSREPEGLSKYNLSLDIPYEDEEILIVNKPAGLVVHPAPGHKKETLVNILFHQKKLSPGSHPLRPGIVHRLDKDTSGLLVLAKSKISQDHLIKQFKGHHVKREYWAISLRTPSPFKATVETWISRHPVHRKKFISLKEFKPGAKKAITSYELLKQNKNGLSWLRCRLKTGRTHQIRIHLASLFCPLAGDELYGGKKKLSFLADPFLKEQLKNLNRIALHAHSLGFQHPLSGKWLTYKSPWPEDLKAFLKKLDFYRK